MSVPLGGGRQRTRRGGVDGLVMGGLCEAQPPLDKLELQTVETREIRMEPCLLCLDLEDRACSGSSSTVQLPRQTPYFCPPFVVLTCFSLTRPKARGNSPQ